MRSLRILQIMECTIGGTRRHIRELCSGLCRRGHRVTVVCSAERDPTFREDMEEMGAAGVEVIDLPMVRSIAPFTDFRHLRFLRGLMKKRKFDLIHTHSSKAGVLGRVAALQLGQGPLFHTPHTFAFGFEGHFNPLKRRLFLLVERFLGKRTDRLIHVSPSEKREALAFAVAVEKHLAVVENGIDPAPFRTARPNVGDGRLFEEKTPGPRLGTVGLLNAAKGHDILIRAFSRLLPRFPDAILAIVGEGALRPALESLISALGLKDRVLLAGYRRDVPALLKELDLFVLPSLWEGMPYVLLEAMASGLPVVVTDVNGSRDIVVQGETGLLVPPADTDQLTEAMARVLGDADLAASMAAKGQSRVERCYTLDKMLERMEEVYLETLGGEEGR